MLACTRSLHVHRRCFIFLSDLFENIGERENECGASIFFFPHPTTLRWRSINPPRFDFLSRALDGLWRENRGPLKICEQAKRVWRGTTRNAIRSSVNTYPIWLTLHFSLRASSPIWASEASLARTRASGEVARGRGKESSPFLGQPELLRQRNSAWDLGPGIFGFCFLFFSFFWFLIFTPIL